MASQVPFWNHEFVFTDRNHRDHEIRLFGIGYCFEARFFRAPNTNRIECEIVGPPKFRFDSARNFSIEIFDVDSDRNVFVRDPRERPIARMRNRKRPIVFFRDETS